MSNHFNFENTLNELSKLDAPIQRGPMMRWQRKAQEAGLRLTVTSNDQSSSVSPWKPKSAGPVAKTPGKTPMTPLSAKFTPKTPGKTPGKPGAASKTFSKTPNKKAKTPVHGQRAEDRFIPNRTSTDVDLSHYAIANQENDDPKETNPEYQQHLSDALSKGQNPLDAKVLSFRQKVPQAKEGHASSLRVLYSTSKCHAPKAQNTRYIPQQPERILDAPELVDDYYLNLISWSTNNHLAVALGGTVYLWNSGNGNIERLCETTDEEEYISCVSWIKEGSILGLGTSGGAVELWDVNQRKLVRSMWSHAARVGALSWNSYILSSGARSGAIHHHDVRVAVHQVATLNYHSQEVCGLEWSSDGRYLASGGNDNRLNIWEASLGNSVAPLHTLTQHQAAVKALSWCPWQPHLLASGGGTADRHIRFWNASSGLPLNSIDTNSQVCAILWSKEHKEIITGHGYSQNQLIIWKYPAMSKVTELTGHTARILSLAMSPDETMVMSAAADETLRLWKCFSASDSKPKKSTTKSTKDNPSSLSMMHRGIR